MWILNANEMYHHGILGQKWGVRNGPPYPLTSERKSAQEKHSITSLKSGGTIQRNASRASQSLETHNAVLSENKKANPDWNSHHGELEWENNCSHSVLTFVARLKGLDVKATPMKPEDSISGITPYEFGTYFKGGLTDENTPKIIYRPQLGSSAKSQEKYAATIMEKQYKDAPNGAYGMSFYQTPTFGHFFAWYKDNNHIFFIDPQSGLPANETFIFENINRSTKYYGYAIGASTRLDNREFDSTRISEFSTPFSSDIQHTGIVLKTTLCHYGVLGMKWGVRRTPEQLGHRKQEMIDSLKAQYRSKIQTSKTHYSKAVRDVNKAKNESDKKMKAYYKHSGEKQYGKGRKYEREAAKIQTQLNRIGTEVSESSNYFEVKEEAGKYYIKKALPRRIAEMSMNDISMVTQVAAQQIVRKMLPMPLSSIIATKSMVAIDKEPTAYKMKL